MPKIVFVFKKVRIFATAKPKGRLVLGYGVMVTLQILVLSFLVRIQVAQQKSPLEISAQEGDFSIMDDLVRENSGSVRKMIGQSCCIAGIYCPVSRFQATVIGRNVIPAQLLLPF